MGVFFLPVAIWGCTKITILQRIYWCRIYAVRINLFSTLKIQFKWIRILSHDPPKSLTLEPVALFLRQDVSKILHISNHETRKAKKSSSRFERYCRKMSKWLLDKIWKDATDLRERTCLSRLWFKKLLL